NAAKAVYGVRSPTLDPLARGRGWTGSALGQQGSAARQETRAVNAGAPTKLPNGSRRSLYFSVALVFVSFQPSDTPASERFTWKIRPGELTSLATSVPDVGFLQM